jgi:hypothetical protein
MSQAPAEPAPPASWLDSWLASAAGHEDMGLRANAAIAYATMGGRRRLDQFVDLVGATALEMRRGNSAAAEAIAVALKETEQADFDNAGLKAVLDVRHEGESEGRKVARALLMPDNPISAWWRLRRIALRPSWPRAMGLAIQYSAATLATLLFALWLVLDLSPKLRILGGENFQGLLVVLASTLILSIGASRLATPGLRRRMALVLDGLFCGLAAAAVPALAVLIFTPKDQTSEAAFFAPVLWACVATWWLAVASLRIFVGATPLARPRIQTVVGAISWPILWVSLLAMLGVWVLDLGDAATATSREKLQQLLSWFWFGFLVMAPPFAALTRAGDEMRAMHVAPFHPFKPPHPGFLAAGALVLTAPMVYAAIKPVLTIPIADNGGVPGPFTVTNDMPFRLSFSGKAPVELAFDDPSSDFRLIAGDNPLPLLREANDMAAPPADAVEAAAAPALEEDEDSRRDSASSDTDDAGLAKPINTRLGRHYLVQPVDAKRLCLVDNEDMRCGVPTLAIGAWLRILTGRTNSLGRSSDHHFYVVRTGNAQIRTLSLPKTDFDASSAHPLLVYRGTVTPTPDAPVLRLFAPRELLLELRPADKETLRDRVMIAQLDDDQKYEVYAADDPDPPDLKMRLEKGRSYLLCLRMVSATFLDCTHQTRGVLSEPLELTLTAPPAKPMQTQAPEKAPEAMAPLSETARRRLP